MNVSNGRGPAADLTGSSSAEAVGQEAIHERPLIMSGRVPAATERTLSSGNRSLGVTTGTAQTYSSGLRPNTERHKAVECLERALLGASQKDGDAGLLARVDEPVPHHLVENGGESGRRRSAQFGSYRHRATEQGSSEAVRATCTPAASAH